MKIKDLMLKNFAKVSEIESQTLAVYDIIKKEIPRLNRLTFEVAELSQGVCVHGFYHIGGSCQSYDSVDELIFIVSETINRRTENEILYRKFN